ncbi:AI-2E family transporter [Candidatus Microgenomates bacterium]|nr:AI-2E family transporter [Candidatus Microgenomates bacterium]
MPKQLSNLTEFRIFLILAIIVLVWHLISLLGSFLGLFTDVALLVFLSWILAFILEPLVTSLANRGLHRIAAAVVIYVGIAALLFGLVWLVLPTTIAQFAQLVNVVPLYLPQNTLFSSQIQSFLVTTLSNSVAAAGQLASGLTGLLLIFIISFYVLISKKEISTTIKNLIPDEYEDDYEFLENVINTTFASFLRVQVFLGVILGFIAFLTLAILRIDFALSTGVASGILAMVPAVGPFLFLIPPILAALTISVEKLAIVVIVLVLAAQLVYNFLSPKLLGEALKIHPLIVLLSFLIGYKLAGVWGAIFAVPVTSALAIIGQDILEYWQDEADK